MKKNMILCIEKNKTKEIFPHDTDEGFWKSLIVKSSDVMIPVVEASDIVIYDSLKDMSIEEKIDNLNYIKDQCDVIIVVVFDFENQNLEILNNRSSRKFLTFASEMANQSIVDYYDYYSNLPQFKDNENINN